MSFEDISYLEFSQPPYQWSETICAILVEGIMRNNSVKLDQWFRRRWCLKDFSSRGLVALVFSRAELFMQFSGEDVI